MSVNLRQYRRLTNYEIDSPEVLRELFKSLEGRAFILGRFGYIRFESRYSEHCRRDSFDQDVKEAVAYLHSTFEYRFWSFVQGFLGPAVMIAILLLTIFVFVLAIIGAISLR